MLMNSTSMNTKRLIISIVVAFIGIWIMDFLIHGVWLANSYKASMSLWRSETDMQSHMGWLMMGQLLGAATFVILWAKGFAANARIGGACLFGLLMGLFNQATTLATYAVQPLPSDLAV